MASPPSTCRARVDAGAPPTTTRPASIASTARVWLGTRPRRTSSTSSRRRTRPSACLGRRFGRGLLGGRGLLLRRRRLLGLAVRPRQPALECGEIGLRGQADRTELTLHFLLDHLAQLLTAA